MNTMRVVFDCPLPPWLVAAAAAVVAGVALFFLRRDTAHLRPLVRRTILALAAAAAVLLAGILLSPKFVRTWPDPHKPLCTVLVDGSRSMLLTDSYSGKLLERLNPKEAPAAGPREVARQELVSLLLAPGPEGWLTKVRESFDIAAWRFAGSLDALSLSPDAPPFEVHPEGYTTALGEALDQVTRGVGGARPRAVVLLSDGAWNTGRDPSEVARVLGRMGIPV
ncbi:MAG TPA: hypothetical protein P5532_24835, partial [Planctomycetota bacterium]|nr:hypothetical protein [Planctomycetota bacterium]